MVNVRIAEHEGHIYLDLADTAWRAAEIGPDSWRAVAEPPVCFQQASWHAAAPDAAAGRSAPNNSRHY